MSKYNFYYDESSHSRKINYDTVNAENYYDNFIVAVVGWKEEKEKDIFEKYEAFEAKYADRKSKGELKSQTLKQNQFKYGFASVNKSNAAFLNDYFSVFNKDTFLYLAITSKIEYIIAQIFDNYKNSFLFDADLMKYSIVKALYLIPEIELQPIEVKRLEKYGRIRRAFLQEHNPMLFNDLVLTEQLFPHLYEVQVIAEKRVEVIMKGLLEKNPAPEKEVDAMAWVRHMNMLKEMAEEIVVREVIYT